VIRFGLDSYGSGGPVAGSCEDGNEFSSFKKAEKFLEKLSDY